MRFLCQLLNHRQKTHKQLKINDNKITHIHLFITSTLPTFLLPTRCTTFYFTCLYIDHRINQLIDKHSAQSPPF